MVASRDEVLRHVIVESTFVMNDHRGLAVHQLLSVRYRCAHCFGDCLVTQAYSEHRRISSECGTNNGDRYTGFRRLSPPLSYVYGVVAGKCLHGVVGRERIVAQHRGFGAELMQ